MIRLETVLDSWKSVREDAALAVEEFPAAEMDFKAAPGMDSFGEIARHILNAGHGLTGMVLAGVENLAVPEFRELVKRHASPLPAGANAAELAAEMRRALEQRRAELAKQPPEFFSKIITRFDGQQVTRLEMIQFIKEHELTHRAQLFVCMRMKGLVPATTRRRQARK